MTKQYYIGVCILTLLSGGFGVYKYNTPHVGQLILPQITGLYYQTSSGLFGHTKAGNFTYFPDDTVTFFIGNKRRQYALGTAIAQPQIALAQFSNSSKRTNNLLRLLAALDRDKNNLTEIELTPKVVASAQYQRMFNAANWHASDITLPALVLPSIEQASQYINPTKKQKNNEKNNIVLEPLNVIFQSTLVRLRDLNGNLCFYDLSKAQPPSYEGPIGHINYKVVKEGIYLYPDIGDFYGSWDHSVDACDVNTANRRPEPEFIPMTSFEGYKGVLGCALKGCSQHDLSGFSIDDYADGNNRKYRTVALNFEPTAQLVVLKTQGLGPKDGVRGANFSEGLNFTSAAAVEQKIEFNGVWQETSYSSSGDIARRCLLIEHGKIYASLSHSDTCSDERKQYEMEVTHHFTDMWWLKDTPNYASLGQLNTPVKWIDELNNAQYTTWEYLPTGSDWQSGVLHRFSQVLASNAAKSLFTTRVTEYIKISD